jgi:UDP-glucose 4-epimerase
VRVLVTGASTPLGRALIDRLVAARDVELVLAVAREPLTVEHARLVSVGRDLVHAREVHDLLWDDARDLGIDVVIHGMQHRSTNDSGRRVHAQNVVATRELLIGCLGHPSIQRIVYRSFAEIYALGETSSNLLDEEAPLAFDQAEPQWLRDRLEADQNVCAHLGGPLAIAVLRFAEILAPGTGSQLWDYLQSRICFRPLGFDPMLNVLGIADATEALVAAARSDATGVFNIPGADTLPLSSVIEGFNRPCLPVPGPLMSALYGLRRRVAGFDFRYDLNLAKFHFGGILDGTRANVELGYTPRMPLEWPQPWWRALFARLAAAPR